MGRGNEAQQVRFVSVKAERPYHPSRARGGGSGGSASQREAPPWQRQCRCDSIRLPDFVALGLRGVGSGGRGPPRRRRRDSIRPPPLRRARPKKDEPTDTHSLTFVQMHKRNQTTQKGQPAERSLQTNGLSVAKTWRKTLNRNNPATFFCLGCERSTYSRKSVEKFSPNVVSFGTDDNAFFLEIRIPAQKKRKTIEKLLSQRSKETDRWSFSDLIHSAFQLAHLVGIFAVISSFYHLKPRKQNWKNETNGCHLGKINFLLTTLSQSTSLRASALSVQSDTAPTLSKNLLILTAFPVPGARCLTWVQSLKAKRHVVGFLFGLKIDQKKEEEGIKCKIKLGTEVTPKLTRLISSAPHSSAIDDERLWLFSRTNCAWSSLVPMTRIGVCAPANCSGS